MSGSIPASQIVSVTPSVINAGGQALDLIELMITKNTRVPIGTVPSFPTLAAVQQYFGATTTEAAAAAVYFNGFENSNKKPGALLFAQYPATAVSAYLRGGSLAGMTLAQLQSIISTTLAVTIDGVPSSSSNITLSVATSFTKAAQLINKALALPGAVHSHFTASMGASCTATGSSTNLTVSSVTGYISPGDIIPFQTGIPSGTLIVSQSSGTFGGAGVYVTSKPTTVSGASITISSPILNVTAVTDGTIGIGDLISGTGLTAGDLYVSAIVSGIGGVGQYNCTNNYYIASEAMTAAKPGVTYDAVAQSFVISSPSTGGPSTLAFATGSAAIPLKLTQATGAVLSQGANATTPAAFMPSITALTQNWATFQTLFDPDAGSGNTQKLDFAAWVNTTNKRFIYLCRDTDITATESTMATASLGNILTALQSDGTIPIYEPAGSELHLAAFVGGMIASIDFTQTNGRITLAFKSQGGLTPSVTDATTAANLIANGYNFYGAYATANQGFEFFYPGSITGEFDWADSYANQIQLNSALQLALMELLIGVYSIPYNEAGYGLVRTAILDPATQAVNFGSIQKGVTLSNLQKAEVKARAGNLDISTILFSQGFYTLVQDAPAQSRGTRSSPPCAFIYMDGGSIQQINLASIEVQ